VLLLTHHTPGAKAPPACSRLGAKKPLCNVEPKPPPRQVDSSRRWNNYNNLPLVAQLFQIVIISKEWAEYLYPNRLRQENWHTSKVIYSCSPTWAFP
jgi:hypothetical protein